MSAIIYKGYEKFEVEKKRHDFPVPEFSCNPFLVGLEGGGGVQLDQVFGVGVRS